jgi:sec-independent protein translocase protein TatA
MFENVGAGEILLILIVVLVFFGPKKIPELAASLGKGLRKFNDAKDNLESQVKTVMKEPLEAINEAKQGFERQLTSAASELTPAAAVVTQVAPQLQPPVESQPRGVLEASIASRPTPPPIPKQETTQEPPKEDISVQEIPKHEA